MEAPERFYLKQSMDGPSCEYVRGDIVESIRQQRRDEHSEIERLRKLIGELRGAMPLEKLGGDDPEWLADLKRRAAEAAKGES